VLLNRISTLAARRSQGVPSQGGSPKQAKWDTVLRVAAEGGRGLPRTASDPQEAEKGAKSIHTPKGGM